jgi:hypothetical protein
MRRAIVRPEVGLDLDDPAGATARLVVADESDADKCAAGVECRAGQDVPVEDAQTDG